MAQVSFHCATPDGIVVNRSVAEIENLSELFDHAAYLIQALTAAPNLEDWREWVLQVRDDFGTELLSVPFSSFLGKPH